jgi:hypothetical protein
MCINDPHEMFRGLEEEKQINDRIKRLFEILDYDPDDRVEKVGRNQQKDYTDLLLFIFRFISKTST